MSLKGPSADTVRANIWNLVTNFTPSTPFATPGAIKYKMQVCEKHKIPGEIVKRTAYTKIHFKAFDEFEE